MYIGESIPYSRMYTPPNKVLGQFPSTWVSDLKVNNGTANVEIQFNKVARFTKDNITVEIQQ